MPGTVNGNFEARGDTDWFRFHVEEGKTYTVWSWDQSLQLELMGPDGTPVSSPMPYLNAITFVATQTGDYWVSATNNGEPRFYSFEVVEEITPNPATIDTSLTLAVGETESGSSYSPDEWYAVDLVAGQSYLLSSELVSQLYLSDAEGNLVTLSDDQLHYTPTESGTYYAGVHFSGAYSVSLEAVSDDHGTSASAAGTLSIGAATNGVWEAGSDSDWYAITLEAGSSYSFSLTSDRDGIQPLQIYNASGQLVLQDTSGAGDPTILFSPDTSGTYYVAATNGSDYYSPHGNWAYAVTAELVLGDVLGNKLTSGLLTIGTDKNGTFEETADSDWYAVTLTAGQSYSFDLSTTGENIDVALYDASGNEIARSYNGPGDSFARLGYTAVASGTYYVGVNSNGHLGTATYTVTSISYTDDLASNSTTSGSVTVGGAAAGGTFEAPGDSDWFAVELSAGVSYVFGSDNALVVMRDAQGNLLTNPGWGDTHYTPSDSGTYYIDAIGTAGESYSVTIGQVEDDYRQDILSTGVLRSQTIGNSTNEVFVSTSDHDSFSGQGGDDRFVAGEGFDQYFGGSGIDTVSFTEFAAGVTVRLWQGGLFENGAVRIQIGTMENVEGTDFDDVIEGNSAANVLIGGAGSDTITGRAGDDLLDGSVGNDLLDGGTEIDTASFAGASAGVSVNLSLAGAQDTLGAGTDTLMSIENLIGSAFADTLRGDGKSNILSGGDGDDRLFGGAGNDSLRGGLGYDRMYGGIGNDTYYASDADDYAYENEGEGTDRVIASIDHQLRANVENLILTGAAAIGKGNDLANTITGSSGANKLYGYDGDDILFGGAGDDYLLGGAGNDILEGAGGYDRMYGGTGHDTYAVNDTTDYAYENAGEGIDRVNSSINHTLRANVEELALVEGAGDLRGYGNAEDNLIAGNSGNNLLYGRDGSDALAGEAGNDILYGENGLDHLIGGSGQDRYYGGADFDLFIFRDGDFAGMSSGTADRIHDFSQADGDQIHLSAVDANSALAGDQAFAFIGSTAFTGVAGQLRYQQISGNTYVQGDVDGDGTADFWIRLDGLHTLNAGDFII